LVDDFFDLCLGEWQGILLHVRVQILVYKLEYQIEHIVHPDYLKQLDDVWMIEFFERFDLPQLDALVPAFELFLHGFDGNDFTGLHVDGLVHAPKGSVADGLDDFVFVHFNLYNCYY